MDERAKWERILTDEGMPEEIRPLTRSQNGSHPNGLVCVSAEDKFESNKKAARNWTANKNLREFGNVTAVFDLEVAHRWRYFSGLIWESGLTGDNLEFLLSYAEHGNLLRACREFDITRERGRKLIQFVWSANAENQKGP